MECQSTMLTLLCSLLPQRTLVILQHPESSPIRYPHQRTAPSLELARAPPIRIIVLSLGVHVCCSHGMSCLGYVFWLLESLMGVLTIDSTPGAGFIKDVDTVPAILQFSNQGT